MKTLRDLLAGPPHPIEVNTLQMVAYETRDFTPVYDRTAGFTARLPGDADDHPLSGTTPTNPFPGQSVLALSRALREGSIRDPAVERKVRAYIDQYQKLTGEVIYRGGNHTPVCPTGQQYANADTVSYGANNLRRADPYPYDRG